MNRDLMVATNANAELDSFAEEVLRTPTGVSLRAPWSGKQIRDEEQAAAAALIRLGQWGATRDPKGTLVLYAGRWNAGNPLARILGGWTTYGMALIYLTAIWLMRGQGTVFWDWIGLAWASLGGLYFLLHGLHQWKLAVLWASALSHVAGNTRLGALVFAATAGLAAATGFGMRIWG